MAMARGAADETKARRKARAALGGCQHVGADVTDGKGRTA
jgi:hypothetical protein